MCVFDGVWRENYFGGEPIRRNEVELRVEKPKNRKAVGEDYVREKMIKGGREWVD